MRVLSEVGGSSAEVAECGLAAIASLADDNETNRRLLGDAGAAAGTHTYIQTHMLTPTNPQQPINNHAHTHILIPTDCPHTAD